MLSTTASRSGTGELWTLPPQSTIESIAMTGRPAASASTLGRHISDVQLMPWSSTIGVASPLPTVSVWTSP